MHTRNVHVPQKYKMVLVCILVCKIANDILGALSLFLCTQLLGEIWGCGCLMHKGCFVHQKQSP